MASAVLYGLPDNGHDIADVHTALKKLHYDCHINACFRLGRVSSSELRSSPPRPIMIILPSPSECNRLLDFSNMQWKNLKAAGLHIMQWLSQVDMNKLKQLRLQCNDLNTKATTLPSGKKLFVVISGRLMKHDAAGKLSLVKQESKGNATQQPAAQNNPSQGKAAPTSPVAPTLCSSQTKNA